MSRGKRKLLPDPRAALPPPAKRFLQASGRRLHRLGDLVGGRGRVSPPLAREWGWLRELGIRTLIDIGAYHGEFAQALCRELGPLSIVAFEPLPEAFAELQRRFRQATGFRAFPVALGDSNQSAELYVSSYAKSSSLLPLGPGHRAAFPFALPERTLAVRTERLDEALRGIALTPEILIKADVQGVEDRVIRGGEAVFRQARAAVIEVSYQPLYEGQCLFADVFRLMADLGFRFAGNWDQLRDPRDGRIVQGDAIFLRER
jgi:FkbM family methyltransferase